MRARLGVVFALIGALVAGSGTVRAESDAPPAKPPPGKMIARTKFAPIDHKAMITGQEAELVLLRSYGMKTVRAPDLVAYLNKIADRLQAKARTAAPIRIVIADDHLIVRQGLRLILETEEEIDRPPSDRTSDGGDHVVPLYQLDWSRLPLSLYIRIIRDGGPSLGANRVRAAGSQPSRGREPPRP